jgi:hypothetical protein
VVDIPVIPVIAELIIYPEENKNTGSKTNRETKDIDCRIALVAHEVAIGSFDVIREHNTLDLLWKIRWKAWECNGLISIKSLSVIPFGSGEIAISNLA